MADNRYLGWVSNVSGQLFFHLSQPWNYRLDRIVGDMIHFDEKINDKRHIIISLLADLRDFNCYEKIAEDAITKYTRIVFIAKEETITKDGQNQQQLSGTLFFLVNKNKEIFQKDEQERLQELHIKVEKYIGLKKEDLNSDIAKLEDFQSIEKYICDRVLNEWQEYKFDGTWKRSIEFILDGDGFIELFNDDNAEKTHQAFYQDFLQAYYFIKFVFHNHVHHHVTSEDILDIYPKPDNDNDKKSISIHLIKDIKKYIAEVRKRSQNINGSNNTYIELTGMIAYANTMIQQLKDRGYIDDTFMEEAKNYFSNLTISIQAHIANKKGNEYSTFARTIDAFIKIQVLTFSVLTPYFLIKSRAFGEESIACFLEKSVVPIYIFFIIVLSFVVLFYDRFRYQENSFIIKTSLWGSAKVNRFLKQRNNLTLDKKDIGKYNIIYRYIDSYHTNNRKVLEKKLKYSTQKSWIIITLFIIVILL